MKRDGLRRLLGRIAITVITGYTCRDITQGICDKMLNYIAMPAITSLNYNPFHTEPIDAVERLRGLIKCPVLLRFCKQDGVLENPDEDSVHFYAALREGNEKKTHVIITRDGGHNSNSAELKHAESSWITEYDISSRSNEIGCRVDHRLPSPTAKEFRSRVFAS